MEYGQMLYVSIVFSLITHCSLTAMVVANNVKPLLRINTRKLDIARAHAAKETKEVRKSLAELQPRYAQVREQRYYIVWLLKRTFGNSHGI